MAMPTNVYRLVVYEVLADPDAEGVTATEIQVRSTAVEAPIPEDAVRGWASQLEDEEAS